MVITIVILSIVSLVLLFFVCKFGLELDGLQGSLGEQSNQLERNIVVTQKLSASLDKYQRKCFDYEHLYGDLQSLQQKCNECEDNLDKLKTATYEEKLKIYAEIAKGIYGSNR